MLFGIFNIVFSTKYEFLLLQFSSSCITCYIHQYKEIPDFFKPLDFTQIVGAPHGILRDAIKKLPTFQGNNAITIKSYL